MDSKRIRILDCTLRDGGYCNQWRFGVDGIKTIIQGLVEAGIDVVELGYLSEFSVYDTDLTLFPSVYDAEKIIKNKYDGSSFVLMINYGEFGIDKLVSFCDGIVTGIRIAFHKKDMYDAIEYAKHVKEKGYQVYLQPMVTKSYSKTEYEVLLELTNELNPFCFYIVDSFGSMMIDELNELFAAADNRLNSCIMIGFHSHNNMQMSYANAQLFTSYSTNRMLMIDCSVYGMGRGAGNLNTELFVEYVNRFMNGNYQIEPVLRIIDDPISYFYDYNPWGYSLSTYLCAKYNTHSKYAEYLDEKKTLSYDKINKILCNTSENKRLSFDAKYIENEYENEMEKGNTNENNLAEFIRTVSSKYVLIIAQGKSVSEEKSRIIGIIHKYEPIVISVNRDSRVIPTDYVFVSNIRRFKKIHKSSYAKCIITSNILCDNMYIRTSYKELTNNIEAVKDNSGLMLIKFLINCGTKKIMIAGMDGYSYDQNENYSDTQMAMKHGREHLERMNRGMCQFLEMAREKADIKLVTTEHYIV